MDIILNFNPDIKDEFPDLKVSSIVLSNLKISRSSQDVEVIENKYFSELRRNFSLKNIKDDTRIRSYRDFYWRINIDPTKTRPAAEALIRRILANKPLWRVNTFVDSYNISSALSRITLGAYDLDIISNNEDRKISLYIRRPQYQEKFLGIAMKEPKILKRKEILLTTENSILSIYPYRDAHFSRIQLNTKTILLIAYGVPHISEIELKEALELTVEIYMNFDKEFKCSKIEYFQP